MAVLMVLKAQGDPSELERNAAANPDRLVGITDRAKANGLISHRFYGNDSGTIMVVDEWETEDGFHTFFAASPEIPEMMAEVGVTAPPEITFYRELDTNDRV
jgi:heme-degrading monooxygenase HmoA